MPAMPFPKPALSDAALRAWGRDRKRREIPDDHVPGLIARGEPSGNPTFHVRKRIGGRRVRVSLGSYPELSLKQARAAAIDALAKLQRGIDPTTEKTQRERDALAGRAEPETVRARWRAWQEAKDRDWSPAYAERVRQIGKADVLPALGGRVLAATRREDWTRIIIAKRATAPGQAAVLFKVIASFHGYAEAVGWLPHMLLPRRREHIAPEPPARSRVLTDAELRLVWQAAEALPPPARALVRLLTLLGARVGEVAGIVPAELDLAAGSWTLPAARSKNKHPYTLPLGPLALPEMAMLLATHPRLGSVSYLKARLDRLSGVTGWRLHDLRRTCRTGLARLNVSRETAEACLNHMRDRGGVVGVYDRHDYTSQIREAMLSWHDHVAGIVSEADAARASAQIELSAA
jgi:integrase